MFQFLPPEMNFSRRFVLKNLWLFGIFVIKYLTHTTGGNALLRTTTAPFKVESDPLHSPPTLVRARVNFRLLPGDFIVDVLTHIKKIIGNQDTKIGPGKALEPRNSVAPEDLLKAPGNFFIRKNN